MLQALNTFQKMAIERVLRNWIPTGPHDYGEVEYMDVIAKERGWNPLRSGEAMTVTIANKQYTVTRDF